MAVVPACSAPEATAPETGGAGADFPAGTSGDGSTVSDAETIVGGWERLEVIQFETDVVSTVTRWRFRGDGTCGLDITTLSLAEGIPRTSVRTCVYAVGPLQATITFSGSESATFDLSFPGFDPDRMLLDGFEYRRVD